MQSVGELHKVRGLSFGARKADLHNVEERIIAKYLGTPYRHRGRSLAGVDCWGFIKLVYADLGIRLFDIEELEYKRAWFLEKRDYLKDNLDLDWEKVENPMILDGILFVNRKGIANHAGIVLSEGRFIHASRQGVIVSSLSDPAWKTRIESFYRLKEKIW
jgi:peptidoglycan endopeptidase LytE